MRPLSLELRGFTSFRDPQVIDFDGFDLFALWGPTGSGKSSILDAMTYALYGYVDRVGKETTQLVSQGQPRMAVLFSFELGDRVFRVTRSTPAKGGTTARLEVLDGTDWKSYGEGADRVGQVTKYVVDLLGLDYTAFTRSVLLPQGKFAEFLTGDAKVRRKILTELLGLELFGQMAGLAGGVARAAKDAADARLSMLADHYAHLDPAAVDAAEREAAAAGDLVVQAQKVEKKLDDLATAWDREVRQGAAMADCAEEISGLARSLKEHAAALSDLAAEARDANARIETAARFAEEATVEFDRVSKEQSAAEADWGTYDDLVEAKELAGRLRTARVEAERAIKSATDARDAATKAAASVGALEKDVEGLSRAAEEAQHSVAEKETVLEQARTEDLVGAISRHLEVGVPCPVCDRPLEKVKKVSPEALAVAEKSVADARAVARAAEKAVAEAEKKLAVAAGTVEEKQKQAKDCDAEAKRREADVAGLSAAVEKLIPVERETDVPAEIDRRLDALKELIRAVKAARAAADEARDVLRNEEKAAADFRVKVAARRSAIEVTQIDPAIKRLEKVAEVSFDAPLPSPLPEDVGELAEVAGATASALDRIVAEVKTRSEEGIRARARLLGEARAEVGVVVPEGVGVRADDVKSLVDAFRSFTRDAEKEATAAAERLKGVRSDLDKKASLEKEVEDHRGRQATYGALALELRGDKIVDFLQGEALAALAAAGSERLGYLSGGRYELAFEGDEFYVVDAWNGDERRPVRTLSGGETFIASLALALALSDEVKNLAVTDRAPVESLFLDEGFGTLDTESLETVVSAIEQLGGDGRMVGVITHVAELADRLPIRLNVTKSPRGSTVTTRPQSEELTGAARR